MFTSICSFSQFISYCFPFLMHSLFLYCNFSSFTLGTNLSSPPLFSSTLKTHSQSTFTQHLHKRGFFFSLQFFRRKANYMPFFFLKNTGFQTISRSMLLTKFIRIFSMIFFFLTLSFIIPSFHKSFLESFQSII